MSKNKKRKESEKTGAYKTLALAEEKTRNKKTGAAIPSVDNVIEAREWVNGHKL